MVLLDLPRWVMLRYEASIRQSLCGLLVQREEVVCIALPAERKGKIFSLTELNYLKQHPILLVVTEDHVLSG